MLKELEKNQFIPFAIVVLIAIEIFFYSTLPGGGAGEISKLNLSMLYHFCIFFLFSFFLLMTLKGRNKINWKYILIALIISIFYSISDEFHQMFVPGRSSTIRDILFNTAGSLFAIGVYWFVGKRGG